ncbi:hypothetical protein FHW64_005447 [Variovorax sp. Sphag1AA]|nr:hypothetical protein [Variovorax sp. Sphag1AA]
MSRNRDRKTSFLRRAAAGILASALANADRSCRPVAYGRSSESTPVLPGCVVAPRLSAKAGWIYVLQNYWHEDGTAIVSVTKRTETALLSEMNAPQRTMTTQMGLLSSGRLCTCRIYEASFRSCQSGCSRPTGCRTVAACAPPTRYCGILLSKSERDLGRRHRRSRRPAPPRWGHRSHSSVRAATPFIRELDGALPADCLSRPVPENRRDSKTRHQSSL